MVQKRDLVKLAKTYQKQAFAAYGNALVEKMKGLANGGIVATNHLLANPRYAHSPGLSAIKEKLPTVINELNQFDPNNNVVYTGIETALGSISFYTDRSNAGTGYDPITAISEQGYTAPAYYITNLTQLFNTLKSQRVIELDQPEKTTNDPLAVQLKRQEQQSKKV